MTAAPFRDRLASESVGWIWPAGNSPETESEVLPLAAPPISATVVFTPRVLLTLFPLPVVWMDREAERRLIFIVGVNVPAIALFVADNFGRSGRSDR